VRPVRVHETNVRAVRRAAVAGHHPARIQARRVRPVERPVRAEALEGVAARSGARRVDGVYARVPLMCRQRPLPSVSMLEPESAALGVRCGEEGGALVDGAPSAPGRRGAVPGAFIHRGAFTGMCMRNTRLC
jgi:hypothetical protein